jgi:hypothetical protein
MQDTRKKKYVQKGQNRMRTINGMLERAIDLTIFIINFMALTPEIEKLKGLDKNNAFILYRAFGKSGTSKEQVSHGFIRKVVE